MSKKITTNVGLTLLLLKNDFTARVIYSPLASGNILIPRSIEYQSQEYLITKIENGAFKYNVSIKTIKFTDDSSVISIGKNCLKKSSIESIEIPPSVDELEEGWCNLATNLKRIIISPKNVHFKYSNSDPQIILGKSDKTIDEYDVLISGNRDITTVKIPSSIKTINSYAFAGCEFLETVEISENSELRQIGKKAFSYSLIRKLFIPSKLEKIEGITFFAMENLNSVIISPKNRFFKYADEEHKIIVGKSDTNNDDYDVLITALCDITKVKIPPNIKRIDSYSFYNCSYLKSVEITENSELISIGRDSFYYSNIESIFIPPNLKILEDKWYQSYNCLKKVIISPKNKHFKYADEEHQIVVGKSDETKEEYDVIVIGNRDITTVKIPNNIKIIESNAFSCCSKLTKVEIEPNSKLERIGERAFESTNITTFVIPKSVEIIGQSCFGFCEQLKKIEIEKGSKLQSISPNLFMFCDKLEEIEIPEESEIKTIGTDAFCSCPIEKIYIPSSVKELEKDWCKSMYELKEISISSKNKIIGYGDKEHLIIVSKIDENDEKYEVLNYASRSIVNAKIPDSIKFISSFAFNGCKQMKSIEISENSELRIIDEYAFKIHEIESFFFPKNLQILRNQWSQSMPQITISPSNKHFKYADEKHQIVVGKSDETKEEYDVIVIGNRDITTVKIPNNIKIIESNAFSCCSKLTKVEIEPNSKLERIGMNAFSSTGISTFIIPKSVEIIESFCFRYCEMLSRFEIEEGSQLKIIHQNAFSDCKQLKTFIIPENSKLEIIEENTFEDTSIEKLFIPSSLIHLQDNWNNHMKNLSNIKISPDNPKYKYMDNRNQIVVCKSDKSLKNFDVICYAHSMIEKVTIPSYIKYISSSAFSFCKQLKRIEIPENSELYSIGSYSFYSSSIQSLIIPKNVHVIEFYAFNNCSYIKSIEFTGESLINKLDFISSTNLQIISFPNLKELEFKMSNDYDIESCRFKSSIILISAGSSIKIKQERKESFDDDDDYLFDSDF